MINDSKNCTKNQINYKSIIKYLQLNNTAVLE